MTQAVTGSQALQRSLDPSDPVGTIVFLCSADSHVITDQTIMVDGGTEFLLQTGQRRASGLHERLCASIGNPRERPL